MKQNNLKKKNSTENIPLNIFEKPKMKNYEKKNHEKRWAGGSKLESRLPGEISITSDMQMTPPLGQKVKKN